MNGCTDMELTRLELNERRARFVALMERRCPGWDTAVFIDNVNHYYFTGTMQDGILFIYRDGSCLYGVRRSFDRAKLECPLEGDALLQIASYRDITASRGAELGNVYIESESMTITALDRLKKAFVFKSMGSLDSVIKTLRSVKSPYELYWTRISGEKHRILFEERVPALLREGMSEADLIGEMTSEMYKLGYQGIARFHQFQADVSVGQVGFGTNSLYPSRFNGPGGAKGGGAAAPLSADGTRKLGKGDLVFLDTAFAVNGYHTDKTRVFMFGAKPPEELVKIHRLCMEVQKRIAFRLKPGTAPSKIYADIMGSLSESELDRFMGVDNRHRVKFLGHGVGLNTDEFPVLAGGFDEPLEENMVIALEPKKGVPSIGMAGVEDTYIVTPDGGECVTGGGRDIMIV